MADDKKHDEKDQSRFEPAHTTPSRSSSSSSSLSNNAALPVLAYCGSSIMMTVMNKYVLSGLDFNLNFFLLLVQVRLLLLLKKKSFKKWSVLICSLQSVVCIVAIQSCKTAGVITYRDFSSDEAKKCESYIYLLPPSFLF